MTAGAWRAAGRPVTIAAEVEAMAPSRFTWAALLLLVLALSGCAHAPPATGNRAPNAPIDPDYPDINCSVNNTTDCRPGASG